MTGCTCGTVAKSANPAVAEMLLAPPALITMAASIDAPGFPLLIASTAAKVLHPVFAPLLAATTLHQALCPLLSGTVQPSSEIDLRESTAASDTMCQTIFVGQVSTWLWLRTIHICAMTAGAKKAQLLPAAVNVDGPSNSFSSHLMRSAYLDAGNCKYMTYDA